MDVTSRLNFSIIKSSFIRNVDLDVDSELNTKYAPFKLEFYDSDLNKENQRFSKMSKFYIKTQQYFKESHLSNKKIKNIFFQFNISVCDQSNSSDVAIIQVILINKQQRVKLVFSQPIDKVLHFQDEFQNYISNLTGYKAFIDRISVHRSDEDDDFDSVENQQGLTDMLLHFVETDFEILNFFSNNNLNSSEEFESKHFIVNADTILNLLDRSKDSNLLRKYKLSLAEKYDDQGTSTFYKYGSGLDEDFGSFFLWTPNSKNYSTFLSRLLLVLLSVAFFFFSIVVLVICCCMRQKFRRKLKAERAMIKAFGLEQRSLNYHDGVSGYVNSGFDANSLLPIPGTNLYAYEGSNPIWLKKYDKIDPKADPSTATSSAESSSSAASSSDSNEIPPTCCNTNRLKRKDSHAKKFGFDLKSHHFKGEEISSFYLKQIDSNPGTSKSSPNSGTSSEKNTSKNQNVTLLSDISISPKFETINLVHSNMNTESMSSFKIDTLLTFASSSNQTKTSNSNNNNKPQPTQNIYTNESKLLTKNLNQTSLSQNGNYTKIFDSCQQTQQEENSFMVLSQQTAKDYSDLFAVESTVI